MERLSVISKVEKPIIWCARMVVVPKKSSDETDVIICIGLKPLSTCRNTPSR